MRRLRLVFAVVVFNAALPAMAADYIPATVNPQQLPSAPPPTLCMDEFMAEFGGSWHIAGFSTRLIMCPIMDFFDGLDIDFHQH